MEPKSFRLILIGDSAVGKTALLKYFVESKCPNEVPLGYNYYTNLIQVEDGTTVKLQLQDTVGQERYQQMNKMMFRNIDGVLFLYDIINERSFKNIPMWMMLLRENIELQSPVLALVGSKADLSDRKEHGRKVSYEEAHAFAQQHQMHFIETSSKTGENVREIFVAVTQAIYNKSNKDKIGDGT